MPKPEVDAFVAQFGFPGTPAGDRMRESLERLLAQVWDEGYEANDARVRSFENPYDAANASR